MGSERVMGAAARAWQRVLCAIGTALMAAGFVGDNGLEYFVMAGVGLVFVFLGAWSLESDNRLRRPSGGRGNDRFGGGETP